MNTGEFEPVVALARDSLLWRGVEWMVRVWTSAWRSSAVVGAVRAGAAATRSWPIESRVRLGALTGVWAAVGHVVSVLVLPKYVTTGLPVAWSVVLALLLLAIAAAPHAFVRAWQEKFPPPQSRKP